MIGGIKKQLIEMAFDISHTGCRRRYYRAVIRKITDEFLTQLFCFIPITAVESHLSAAGLIIIVMNLNAAFFKNSNHVHPRLRVNLIDEARDKYIYNGHNALLIRDKDIYFEILK
jgi:hypothetical protein